MSMGASIINGDGDGDGDDDEEDEEDEEEDDDDDDDDVCRNDKESDMATDKWKNENERKPSNHTATKLALKMHTTYPL
ncbi:hypothetical protein TWF718_005561 [Orbilia javanica]|uniref:Uncharacterized protein n=1 Tax=Orbilia javanica TaxID=47235 RepID=A0AAN8RNZ4_9PEZI